MERTYITDDGREVRLVGGPNCDCHLMIDGELVYATLITGELEALWRKQDDQQEV